MDYYYSYSPKCCVVQRCISIFVLGLNAAVGLQQDLHYFHMALVSSHLEGRLPLVLYIHLQTIGQYIKVDQFSLLRASE